MSQHWIFSSPHSDVRWAWWPWVHPLRAFNIADLLDSLGPLFYLEKKQRGKQSSATASASDLNRNSGFKELSLATFTIVLPCFRKIKRYLPNYFFLIWPWALQMTVYRFVHFSFAVWEGVSSDLSILPGLEYQLNLSPPTCPQRSCLISQRSLLFH